MNKFHILLTLLFKRLDMKIDRKFKLDLINQFRQIDIHFYPQNGRQLF
jgi:hypothetical protein